MSGNELSHKEINMMRNSLSILIVDDMRFNCEFIRRALKKEDYSKIDVINSAPEALEYLKKTPVDVLMADWIMPEMDGLELTRQIRKLDRETLHYTSIVLLTSKDDSASIRNAFSQGIDDYIIKPPNQIEMAARVYAAGRVATIQNDLLQTTQTLERMFETKCMVDNITGLGHRDDTYKHFAALLKQTHTRGGSICSAILTINKIEELTEQYGQKVREQIISSVANRICATIRPIDLVGHIDKHEFLIAMYAFDSKRTPCSTFKRVLSKINHRSYKTSAGFLNVKCSMSVNTRDQNSEIIEVRELIKTSYKSLV